MSETAWDSLISANKKAELKYRNVNPTLKYCLGCPAPKKSRDLFPRKKNPDTLFNVIEEKYDVSRTMMLCYRSRKIMKELDRLTTKQKHKFKLSL